MKAYKAPLKSLHDLQGRLTYQIDSLGQASLPTDRAIHKLDSCQQKVFTLESKLNNELQDLEMRTRNKLKVDNLPPEMSSKLSALQSSIVDLPSNSRLVAASKPVASLKQLSHTDIPEIPIQSAAGIKVEEPSTLLSVNSIPHSPALAQNMIPDELKELNNASQLQKVNSSSVDEIVSSRVSELKEVQEIQGAAQIPQSDALKSQDALKAEITKRIKTSAIDHFSGKQEKLRTAVDNISKYKLKYKKVSSIKDLPSRPPNTQKEMPVINRLVPGTALQFQKKGGDFLVDFNLYVGFKLTDRIAAGIGWNQRFAVNWNQRSINSANSIFGPRVFGEYNIGKGFATRMEVETMNTLVPPTTVKTGDSNNRQCVPGLFAGIKKEYKFVGRVKGTASIMMRIINPKEQSPYGNIVNMRFGFEFPLKKRSAEH